jgi:hypothetical protein
MKRLLVFGLLFCILATTALAAQVFEKETGLKGSLAHTFTYSANDKSETVVDGVAINDYIWIVYGNSTTGLALKREYYFKTPSGDTWRFDIQDTNLGVYEPSVTMTPGDRLPVDMNNDGAADLTMAFTATANRQATFTFAPAKASTATPNTTANVSTPNATANATPTANTTEEPEEEEKQETAENETNVTAPPPTTPPPAAQSNKTNTSAAPATNTATAKRSGIGLIIIVAIAAVVVLLIAVVVAMLRRKKGDDVIVDQPEAKPEESAPAADEKPKEAEEAEPAPPEKIVTGNRKRHR